MVIFSCHSGNEKITNLTMNLYILRGSLNPSAVLEFSKMYKFIVNFVFFSLPEWQLKMTNCYVVIFSLDILWPNLVIYLSIFLFSFYNVTKSGHLSWFFKLSHLNLSILVIYPLKKIVVTKFFGLLVTNLSFSTSVHRPLHE